MLCAKDEHTRNVECYLRSIWLLSNGFSAHGAVLRHTESTRRGVGARRSSGKPTVRKDYNTFIGAVDLSDQYCGVYLVDHRPERFLLATNLRPLRVLGDEKCISSILLVGGEVHR